MGGGCVVCELRLMEGGGLGWGGAGVGGGVGGGR